MCAWRHPLTPASARLRLLTPQIHHPHHHHHNHHAPTPASHTRTGLFRALPSRASSSRSPQRRGCSTASRATCHPRATWTRGAWTSREAWGVRRGPGGVGRGLGAVGRAPRLDARRCSLGGGVVHGGIVCLQAVGVRTYIHVWDGLRLECVAAAVRCRGWLLVCTAHAYGRRRVYIHAYTHKQHQQCVWEHTLARTARLFWFIANFLTLLLQVALRMRARALAHTLWHTHTHARSVYYHTCMNSPGRRYSITLQCTGTGRPSESVSGSCTGSRRCRSLTESPPGVTAGGGVSLSAA